MGVQDFLALLGGEVTDAEEETFLLFSQAASSHALGIVDHNASTLDVEVGTRSFSIRQSPSVLSSSRSGGTTGAVIWKVTPLMAAWLALPENPLFSANVLSRDSILLELGTGISPLIALTLSPRIGRYIATDQAYVLKMLRENLSVNSMSPKGHGKLSSDSTNIEIKFLDWELHAITPDLLSSSQLESPNHLAALVACDCIYNPSLIRPFVSTCVDACRLSLGPIPTLCIIAQQLRTPEVLESWLDEFMRHFKVWRMPDELLTEALRDGSGFIVHVGVLRDHSST